VGTRSIKPLFNIHSCSLFKKQTQGCHIRCCGLFHVRYRESRITPLYHEYLKVCVAFRIAHIVSILVLGLVILWTIYFTSARQLSFDATLHYVQLHSRSNQTVGFHCAKSMLIQLLRWTNVAQPILTVSTGRNNRFIPAGVGPRRSCGFINDNTQTKKRYD
jgi:hypothetical protein